MELKIIKKISRRHLFVLVVFLAASGLGIFFYQKRFANQLPFGQPTARPTPQATQFLPPASFYATDETVLSIENALKTIGEELAKTDLKEAALNPPVLDMGVNFEK